MPNPVYINPFNPRWNAITLDTIADVYTKQHWPLCFSNLEVYCQPGDVLSYHEANVILAVIEEILNFLPRYYDLRMGTFIIDGYKTGHACKCLLRGNLKDGPTTGYLQPFWTYKSSDELAAEAINDALAFPDEEGSAFARSKRWEKGDYLDSGIHSAESLHVMALNTTSGHFLVSFYAHTYTNVHSKTRSRDGINAMLIAIAETLEHLRPLDKGLQDATYEIIECFFGAPTLSPKYRESVWKVREMFRECEHPVIRAWQSWREANPVVNFFD